MGRLINADDVKKLLVARYENAELITKDIDKIPTAYDVDGVVEELKRMSGIQFDGRNESYELNWCISTDRVVEIVKGAVKDE